MTTGLASAQQRLYVAASAAPGGDGQSWATAFSSLHDALEVALDATSHELWVARGTYTHTDHFTLRVGDALYGGFEGTETQLAERDPVANPTILDGLLDHRVVNGGWDTLVDGFTIRNGRDNFKGAGMRFAGGGRVTLRNLVFENNVSGDDGGALSVSNDELVVENCVFRRNGATQLDGDDSHGGAARFYGAVATFENCVFEGNSAIGRGGAVSNYEGLASYKRCVFRGNSARAAGAVFAYEGTPTFDECVFEDNEAEQTGAIRTHEGVLTVRECEFRGNVALADAGAIQNTSGPTTLIDTVFVGNEAGAQGGALRQGGPVHLIGCRFISNSASLGGAVRFTGGSLPRAMNCEFRGNVAFGEGGGFHGRLFDAVHCTFARNVAPEGGACWLVEIGWITNSIVMGPGDQLSGDPVVTTSLVQAGYPGEGNLVGDPGFRDPLAGDLRLAPTSRCIDAGATTALPPDELDLDGDGDTSEPLPVDLAGSARDVGASPDLGAFESGSGCGRVVRFCDALGNAAGTTARIYFQGTPELAVRRFRLAAFGSVPASQGLFLYGAQEAQVPFGNGYRCLARQTRRIGGLVTAGVQGTVVNTASLPNTGVGAILAGSTWSFQYVYSDPLPAGSGVNASDGVRVQFCP